MLFAKLTQLVNVCQPLLPTVKPQVPCAPKFDAEATLGVINTAVANEAARAGANSLAKYL
jgi:hypothetical protein